MPMGVAVATHRPRAADLNDRIVTIEVADDAWRVGAAHMEPLRFRTEAEAERAGRRVASTLSRLGFGARLESYDAQGVLADTAHYAAEMEMTDWRPPPRRQLHS